MMGKARDERSLAREAYFLDFATEVRKVATMPVMVTGGVRRIEVANTVIDSGVDMVGIATALAICPDLPKCWKAGETPVPVMRPVKLKDKALASAAQMSAVRFQMAKLSKGKRTNPNVWPIYALVTSELEAKSRAKRYRSWAATK